MDYFAPLRCTGLDWTSVTTACRLMSVTMYAGRPHEVFEKLQSRTVAITDGQSFMKSSYGSLLMVGKRSSRRVTSAAS